MDFSQVKAGDELEYIGESWAYDGVYPVVTAESTYQNPDNMRDDDKGKLMIVHLTNSDMALFITLDMLNPNEWRKG